MFNNEAADSRPHFAALHWLLHEASDPDVDVAGMAVDSREALEDVSVLK